MTSTPLAAGASRRPGPRTRLGGAFGWPLVPLAPLVVIVVGLVVAAAIGLFGLSHLAQATRDHAAARAELLASTLGERLAHLRPAGQSDAVQLAARRTGAEVLVAGPDGAVREDATLGLPDPSALGPVLAAGHGELVTKMGNTRYATHPAGEGNVVVVFVRIPGAPEGAPALWSALLALTTLLIGVAAIVAFSVARDADMDITYVSRRVLGMALVPTEPAGEPVPVRTMDEVGALTSAFNDLVARFAAAEQAYRHDRTRADDADRERAAFLAAVSHELRTPLNAILGFADVLMKEVDGPLTAVQREEVQQIRDSGQHLSDLIKDILELSALESGQLRLHPVPVDAFAVAQDLVREAAVVAEAKSVAVRLEGGLGVRVRADPKRLRQILGNVVGNAVKFTQAGEVVVRVETRGTQGAIAVRDTGPGIPAAERSLIFEEYRQAGAERARRRGTGLGLAIARRLALMQGGAIEVESELGKGSTFTVLLPLAREGRP